MKINLSKDLVKIQAKLLRSNLIEPITQSSAYNIIAKMYGFENWNLLSDYLKKNDGETK